MTRDEYYLKIAYAVAEKSSCLRKRYGAVIVQRGEIIATGYNGPPRGEEHCKECTKRPSGLHIDDLGHEKDYLEYLSCPAVHAEQNAIISAARRDMIGSDLYLACTGREPLVTAWAAYRIPDPKPCEICLRLIKNAGIKRVITEKGVIYESNN